MLQRIVREALPAVEVGTMCGYSTILMAQALPQGAPQRFNFTVCQSAATSCAHASFMVAPSLVSVHQSSRI